ncbi:facilitated trehalose transporter Tret1-like [Neocloeon triangulifer]|uniref:facilitated trehalose transporter Tret1-like n=1 Tax=Neocloeon triangulifer TaxID=2078957 RepID=UPI00286F4B18|nr:facilitated trehalose transporter Tret1-like [Neocloeon triangulifer]
METRKVYEETCEVMLPQKDQTALPQGKKFPQYVVALIATLGSFCAGTVMAWTSPTLPVLMGPNSPLPITAEEGSWIGCLMAVGALCGALPAGVVSDKLGRRLTMQIVAAPLIVSWVMIIFAPSVGWLYAARIIAGLGVGAVSVVAPIYVGEIAASAIRGSLGGFFQMQLTIGILFTYLFGAVLSYLWLNIISGCIPLVYLVILFFVPETPQNLLSKGKRTEAERSLQRLRGDGCYITEELRQMQTALERQRAETTSQMEALKSIFKEKASRKALMVGLGLMLFQQLSGINAVIFYTVIIFDAAGSTLSPSVATIIVGVVQVVISFLALLLVDRAGRRILLMISSSVMAICLAALGVHFYLLDTGVDVSNYGLIPLASVVLFIIMFSLGFGPIPWTMLGELFPAKIKGAASAMACVENYVLVFVVTKTFQGLLESLGSAGTFWMFGGICIVGTVFVFFLVPETKGKTLDQIQLELAK